MRLSVQDLFRQTIREVGKPDMENFCHNNNFAPGKLRLIPKGETFRPIMTFNRRLPHSKGNMNLTTNKKLGTAHMMLKNLKSKMYKNNFGFAVFNYDDIMKKYEEFAQKWRKAGNPELYFVTMDIEKCYDNVDCEKLVQFLSKTELLVRSLPFIAFKRRRNISY